MGAVPALPVFLACINRGEFCKALSTSSEVKCGRGATKQNKKQHQNVKKIVNYLFKPYFSPDRIAWMWIYQQPAVWREVCGLQGKLGHSFIQHHNLLLWMHKISGWLLTVCVWRRLHRTGVAMLGGFFSKNHVHFNFFKLRQIFLKLRWKPSIQLIPFFPLKF